CAAGARSCRATRRARATSSSRPRGTPGRTGAPARRRARTCPRRRRSGSGAPAIRGARACPPPPRRDLDGDGGAPSHFEPELVVAVVLLQGPHLGLGRTPFGQARRDRECGGDRGDAGDAVRSGGPADVVAVAGPRRTSPRS